METSPTSARKARHLTICLEDDVSSTLASGWSDVRLEPEELPDCALDDVDTATSFLGFSLRAPILISSMSGGVESARQLNERLAAAASDARIAIGLGSGRAAIEDPGLLATFDVRPIAPHAMLFANIGAVSLNYGISLDAVRRLCDRLAVDGLMLHLNPLQEALQIGGDTNFRGLDAKIADLCSSLSVPVVAKSVGSGVTVATARRLVDAGVAAIDVAGAGGTSWARVEGKRSGSDAHEVLAETFADWGIATPRAVRDLRAAFPRLPLIASGGLRSGVDIAKAMAIGADLAGLALPFLHAAHESRDAVDALIDHLIRGLRIAMFASGVATLPNAMSAVAHY